MAAHPAPVMLALIRSLLSPRNGRDLPPIPSSRGGGARYYRCVVLPRILFYGVWQGVPEKQTRPPPDPPAVPVVARDNVRAGGPNDAHWKALCAGELGIEPPLMTTADYYAHHWAVCVSYLPSRCVGVSAYFWISVGLVINILGGLRG